MAAPTANATAITASSTTPDARPGQPRTPGGDGEHRQHPLSAFDAYASDSSPKRPVKGDETLPFPSRSGNFASAGISR